MYKILLSALVTVVPAAFAQDITFVNDGGKAFAAPVLSSLARQNVDLTQYREIRIKAEGSYANVYLLSSKYHRFEKMNFNLSGKQVHVLEPMAQAFKATCPDQTIDFIAFAPNNEAFELSITEGVAQAAEKHGLKVMRLYKTAATAKAYMNYMSCPNVRGNFYDGDANPTEIVTADGTLSGAQMAISVPKVFAYKSVNIWLACQAFNNPMRATMIDTLQSQKYAAGYNDLEVGPSDKTAACAMEAALNGEPMTAAFANCRKLNDVATDQWGFAGHGSDYFGR